jgi:hypothetical protein
MKSMLTVVISLALLFSAPAFGSDNNTIYKSDSIGIQVDYPNNWSYTESRDFSFVYFVPSNESQPNISPSFQKVYLLLGHDTTINDKNISLGKYLEYAKTQLQSRNVTFGQANKTLLASKPGYHLFYTNQNGNKGELFVVTQDGKPYLISYVAVPDKFDQYLPVINSIISSLKFT